jgi:hypothetical protein
MDTIVKKNKNDNLSKIGRPKGSTWKGLGIDRTMEILEKMIVSKKLDPSRKIEAIKMLANLKGWIKEANVKVDEKFKSDTKEIKDAEIIVTFDKQKDTSIISTTTTTNPDPNVIVDKIDVTTTTTTIMQSNTSNTFVLEL